MNREDFDQITEESGVLMERYLSLDVPKFEELTKVVGRRSHDLSFLPTGLKTKQVDRFDLHRLADIEQMFRSAYISRIAFPLYTIETIEALAKFLEGKKVLEIGSGFGYLGRLMQDRGVQYTTLDDYRTSYGTHDGFNKLRNLYSHSHIRQPARAMLRRIHRYDVIVLSWPDYCKNLAYDIARKLRPGQIMIYQGELYGCTANDRFHEYLEGMRSFWWDIEDKLNEKHATINFIHDQWIIRGK